MTQINFEQVRSSFSKLTNDSMLNHWSRLHAGDQEPAPESAELVEAWLLFHNGEFLKAAEMSKDIEGGASLRLKSLSTFAHYLENDPQEKIRRFQEVVALAEDYLVVETGNKCNLYYQIAYSLGRYGQFISVAKALAEGIAGKIHKALRECIALAPAHADAYTALATYQAEIIGKLGKMAAKLTYSVSAGEAESLYEKGVELAPYSVSAKTEFADGLLSIFGQKQIKRAVALYEKAAENEPLDSLEALDRYLAEAELADA